MKKTKKRSYFTKKEMLTQFPWLTEKMIIDYLSEIRYTIIKDNKQISVWDMDSVLEICKTDKNILAAKEKSRKDKQDNLDLRMEYQAFVSSHTPYEKFLIAKQLNRKFILHIGPTNSGKTYSTLEALKGAETGVYLGPLRLMALEVFDKLNDADIPCSLLTGEESISIPCAKFTASTVEMADFQKHYDIAVIDEAQMISDPRRGAHWFDAICQIDAEIVHICMAPEASDLITDLMLSINSPYEIIHHNRLAPLTVGNQLSGLDDILPGDAIVAFSRQKVLAIAAAMKKRGFNPAIIYGGLPPKSRRMEVEDYISGKKDIIVATDAIGMGLSLPIRRIVFAELRKYDGTKKRSLTAQEIQQISGRAGRFGMFEKGEVTSFRNNKFISKLLQQKIEPIQKIRISFPGDAAVSSEYPLKELIVEWQRLPREEWYERENMANALKLLEIFPGKLRNTDKNTIYQLITCPIDADRPFMKEYWGKCAEAVIEGRDIPVPNFGMKTLESCEKQYKALDLYNIMCTRFGMKNYCENFQDEVIRQISILLQKHGDGLRDKPKSTDSHENTNKLHYLNYIEI